MKKIRLSIVLAGILLVGLTFAKETWINGISPVTAFMPKKVIKEKEPSDKKQKPKKENRRNRKLDNPAANVTASKTVSVNGGGNAAPGGILDYTVVLSNSGSLDATSVVFTDILVADLTLVNGSVKATPIAVNDTYTSLGNVGIIVDATNGILANDVSPDNTAKTASAVTDAATTDGGKITINTDGSFDYTPKTGTTSTTDSYTYTLNTSSGTSTATITVSIENTLWFVNSSAASNGDGSLSSPFKDWSDFATANTGAAGKPKANELIFVYAGTYAGNTTLLGGQIILGQGATTSIPTKGGFTTPSFSKTLPATSGAAPVLTSSSGNTIALGSNNYLQGFELGNSGTDISGTNFGTLTVSEVALSGNGAALNLTNGSLAASFSSISSTNENNGSGAVKLTTVSGNLSAPTVTITNPALNGFIFASSTLTATFGNTTISGSGAASISLTGGSANTSSVTFGDLDISPDAGIAAITANAKATLSCSSGTITTSNVTGLSLNGADTGNKLGLTMVLDSYSASNAASGLSIQNTTGSFTVNGSGSTSGSGGTIQTISARGIELVNTAGITLKNINLTNANQSDGTLTDSDNSNANAAIFANAVSGLTLNNLVVNTAAQAGISLLSSSAISITGCTLSNCGTSGSTSEGGIIGMELTGTNTLSNNSVTNSGGRNAYFRNTGTTSLTLTVTGNTFDTALAAGNFLFVGYGTGNSTLTFKNNLFKNPTTHALDVNANENCSVNVQVGGPGGSDGNTITAKTSLPGSDGIYIQGFGAPTINYNVINNNVQTSYGGYYPINIGGQGTGGTIMGRIKNNTTNIANPTVSTSGRGIFVAAYGNVHHISEISGNSVNGAGDYGILAQSSDNATAGSTAAIDATISNNTVNMLDNVIEPSLAHYGVRTISQGSGSSITSCVNTSGNTSNNATVINNFRVSSINSGGGAATVKLQGNYGTLNSAWTTPNPAGGISTGQSGSGTFAYSGIFNCATPTNNAAARLMASNLRDAVEPEDSRTGQDSLAGATSLPEAISTPENGHERFSRTGNISETEIIPEFREQTNEIYQNIVAEGETVTVNGAGTGFTLPAGKSTTITFSAAVSNSPTSCTISNQGTISASGLSNVLTDDPNVGGSEDPPDISLVVPGITSSSISATSVCSGGSIDLTAACTSGSQLNWFTMASGGTSVSTASNYSPSNITTNTTYYASCTIGGCESQRSLVGSVSVNPLPNATITVNPDPICAGATTNLNVADAGVGASYSWSGDGVITADARTTTATPTGTGSVNYSVSIVDGNGCTASSTTSLTVNTTSAPTVDSNSPLCVGSSLNLTSSSADSYSWSGPNGFTSTDQNPTLNNIQTLAAGSYSVTISVSGCTSSAEVAVTVNELPSVSTSGIGTYCEGSTVDFGASGGTAYSWTGPNAFTSSSQNPQLTDFATGNAGTYSVTVTDANGCSATAEVALNYKPLPVVEFAFMNGSTVCEGGGLAIGASISNAVGGDITAYSWTGPDSYTGSANTVNISPVSTANSGEYIVTATLNGCSAPYTTTATVVPKPEAPTADDQHVCTGGDIMVTASCSPGSNVLWFSDMNGNTAASNALTSVTTDQTLYAACESTSLPGCRGPVTSVQVMVDQPVSYTTYPSEYSNLYICENGTGYITLYGIPTGNNLNYQWQISTGGSFSDLNDNGNYTGTNKDTLFLNNIPVGFNNYQYRTFISNACNAVNGDTTTLKINVLPTIITEPAGQTVCTGNETVFSIVTDGTGVAYQWQVDMGSGFVNVSNSGTYMGANSSNLKISGIDGNMNNWLYRCLVFNNCQSITSASASLVVDPTVTVLSQPVNKTICQNLSTSFNIVAANINSGTLAYKWQRKISGSWVDLTNNAIFSGVSSATLNITNAPYSLNGSQFRCLMNDYCQSAVVSLTIYPVATITAQPQNQNICQGNNASYSVSATGINLTYRWQVNTGSGFIDILDGGVYQGATSSTLILSYPTASMNGYLYRCVVKGNGSCDQGVLNSQQASLNVGVSAEANVIVAASPIAGTTPIVYQAVQTVLGINSISSVSNAEYRAGNSILLNPGFTADAGSVFIARIQNPCSLPVVNRVGGSNIPKEIIK